jgi:hypothetical protein
LVDIEHVSLCSQVRNRSEQIKKAVSTWISHSFHEIVIFDWGSDEDLFPYLRDFGDPRISYIRLLEAIPYNLSAAKNAAIRATSTEWVFYVDADICFDENLPNTFLIDPDNFYQGQESTITPIFGSTIFTRSQFNEINGYNENLVGYGYEDTDFFKRLISSGYCNLPMFRGLTHIEHSDVLRGREFDDSDILRTALRNRIRATGSKWGSSNIQKKLRVEIFSVLGRVVKMI